MKNQDIRASAGRSNHLLRTAFGVAVALTAVVSHTAEVRAQQSRCGPRQELVEVLRKKYRETPVAAGVTLSGGLVELLAQPDGATWTIMVTTPEGTSCLVAAGEGWRFRPRPDERRDEGNGA
jgi:hypothetical protein